jgi:predicted  nucleic acid-binding Zn-ribbon protein
LEALNKELKVLDEKRDTFTHTIDQDLLREYVYLKDNKGGQAIMI